MLSLAGDGNNPHACQPSELSSEEAADARRWCQGDTQHLFGRWRKQREKGLTSPNEQPVSRLNRAWWCREIQLAFSTCDELTRGKASNRDGQSACDGERSGSRADACEEPSTTPRHQSKAGTSGAYQWQHIPRMMHCRGLSQDSVPLRRRTAERRCGDSRGSRSTDQRLGRQAEAA